MSTVHPSYIKVKLFTRDKEFVGEVTVPKFAPMPEVLRWDGRTFYIQYCDPEDFQNIVYNEVFAYTAVIYT